LSISPNNLWF